MRALQVLLLLSLVFISVPAHSRPAVSVAPSLVRVRPQALPPQATEIELFAARGEYESFQAIVHAGGSNLSNVTVAGGLSAGRSGRGSASLR